MGAQSIGEEEMLANHQGRKAAFSLPPSKPGGLGLVLNAFILKLKPIKIEINSCVCAHVCVHTCVHACVYCLNISALYILYQWMDE